MIYIQPAAFTADFVSCSPVQGVGPSIVANVCQLASLDPDVPVAQLQQEDWKSLYRQWREWLLTIEHGTFAPHIDSDTGRLSVLNPQNAPLSDEESDGESEDLEGTDVPAESVHELLDGALRSTEVSFLHSDYAASCMPHRQKCRKGTTT